MFNKIKAAMDRPITWGSAIKLALIGCGIDAAVIGGVWAREQIGNWLFEQQINGKLPFLYTASDTEEETEEEG